MEEATTYFVGVYWDINTRIWRASYKCAKGPTHVKVPGNYPTNQRAARARFEYIRAEGLQQFNDMDALDDATDLMVPRKKRGASSVVDGSESRSGRVRKATKR